MWNQGSIDVDIEHDRVVNGLAEITGSVMDATGAAIPLANMNVSRILPGEVRRDVTDNRGQFRFSGLSPGEYTIEISRAGFRSANVQFILKARDRAVLSGSLAIGDMTETVVVDGPPRFSFSAGMVQMMGTGGGVGGGVIGGIPMARSPKTASSVVFENLPVNGRGIKSPDAAARVRSYFPEALYINPVQPGT